MLCTFDSASDAPPSPTPVSVRPSLAQAHLQRVAALEALICHVIETIEVRPRETAGVDLLARGDLARLLALSDRASNGDGPDGGLPSGPSCLVAGARFELTTFRL